MVWSRRFLAVSRSTSLNRDSARDCVWLLRGLTLASDEHRPPVIHSRVDARELLGGGEASEVAAMVFHPIAEALPNGASFVIGEELAVDENGEGSLGITHFTSFMISAACFETSTSR